MQPIDKSIDREASRDRNATWKQAKAFGEALKEIDPPAEIDAYRKLAEEEIVRVLHGVTAETRA